MRRLIHPRVPPTFNRRSTFIQYPDKSLRATEAGVSSELERDLRPLTCSHIYTFSELLIQGMELRRGVEADSSGNLNRVRPANQPSAALTP
jgi:hypothetical protein